jgi:hypothetical protein
MSSKRTLILLCGGMLALAVACNPARDRDEEAAATGGVGTVGDTAYPPPPGQTGTPIDAAPGAAGTPAVGGTAPADTLGGDQPRRP